MRRARKGESFEAILKTDVYLQNKVCLKLKAEQGGEIEKFNGLVLKWASEVSERRNARLHGPLTIRKNLKADR